MAYSCVNTAMSVSLSHHYDYFDVIRNSDFVNVNKVVQRRAIP